MNLSDKNKKTTVIFDMGNVILPFDHMKPCRILAGMCDLTADKIYDKLFGSGLEWEFEAGKISGNRFFEEGRKILNIAVEFNRFKNIWVDIFEEDSAVSDIINRLKPHHELILLSNTNQWHFDFVYDKYKIIRQFDSYILSYKIGSLKPDREIYDAALTLADNKSNIIYIDDIAEYVKAANRLGIDAIHFTDAASLHKLLRHKGIM